VADGGGCRRGSRNGLVTEDGDWKACDGWGGGSSGCSGGVGGSTA
jgi:hypothetical protein